MNRHSLLRDAIISGVLGASGVALWFLGLDLATGQAFATPAALGRALLGIFGPPGGESTATIVLIYTVFHYAAFIGVGFVASAIVHAAERQPAVLAGALMLFVALELWFILLTSILRHFSGFQGIHSWLAVAVGNLIAAAAMGTYLWRAHPALRHELHLALGGDDDSATRSRPSSRTGTPPQRKTAS